MSERTAPPAHIRSAWRERAKRVPGARRIVIAGRRVAFARRLRRFHDALVGTPLEGHYWVWSGLLLGWAREGRPLGHDLNDVDFAVLGEDRDRILAAAPMLVARGFVTRSVFVDAAGVVWMYRFRRGPTQYEFFIVEPDPDTSTFMYRGFEVVRDTGGIAHEFTFSVPEQDRVPFRFVRRDWLKVRDHDAELTAMYGDWRTPDPSWTFMESDTVLERRERAGRRVRWAQRE